ncbi:MAG: ferredoxin reductase family protein [Frankia sp.]
MTVVPPPVSDRRRVPVPPRRGADPEIVVPLAVVCGAIIVLTWCVRGLVVTPPLTHAARLGAGARLTGITAAYLSAVQVLLVGRLPWIERSVSGQVMRLWHGWGGGAVLLLSMVHAGFAMAAQAALARRSFLGAALAMIVHFRFVAPALVGLVLMMAAAVTSIRSLRQRLGYVRWYLVHVGTYLAVPLAFLHELLGADFSATGARIVWSALFMGAGATVFWFRVVVPVRVTRRHQPRVAAVVDEAPDVVSVRIVGRDLEALGALPGQYLRWRVLAPRSWWRARPFSLSAEAGDGLRFTAKVTGALGAELRSLTPGTRIAIEGPYGAFTEQLRTRRRVLLLAGGVGVTPLRALMERLVGYVGPAEAEVTLIYRADRESDLIFTAELAELSRRGDAPVHYLLGPRGDSGRPDPLAPQALAELVPRLPDHDVFVCGPPGMVAVARTSLLAAGVPPSQIHTETFAG